MSQDYIFAAPYPEGAIVKLSEHASEVARLRAFYLPSKSISRAISKIMLSPKLENAGTRLRRGAAHIPETIEVAPWLEPMRLLSKTRIWPSRDREVMDVVKERFDRSVSRRVSEERGVLVGMPGACLRSFKSGSRLFKVFHEVDAHPLSRNDILRSHYGNAAAAEEVPSRVVERIQSELDLADLVLSPSTIVTTQLVGQGIQPSRVAQVPFGVDLDRFQPIRATQERQRPHFVYVGQISYRKGIPFLLEAARGQDFTVQLIGPVVTPDLLADLPDNVTYSTPVAHEFLAAHLASADAFVFPSVEDNFALVVLEALAAGLPVISTDAVGSSEILGSDDGTIVPAGDSHALRRAMQDTEILDWSKRVTIAQAARSLDRSGGPISSWQEYSEAVVAEIDQARSRLPLL